MYFKSAQTKDPPFKVETNTMKSWMLYVLKNHQAKLNQTLPKLFLSERNSNHLNNGSCSPQKGTSTFQGSTLTLTIDITDHYPSRIHSETVNRYCRIYYNLPRIHNNIISRYCRRDYNLPRTHSNLRNWYCRIFFIITYLRSTTTYIFDIVDSTITCLGSTALSISNTIYPTTDQQR